MKENTKYVLKKPLYMSVYVGSHISEHYATSVYEFVRSVSIDHNGELSWQTTKKIDDALEFTEKGYEKMLAKFDDLKVVRIKTIEEMI